MDRSPAADAGRFTARLGNQFAAAMSYFSVLSLVPILMFGFSMLGLTLTVLRRTCSSGCAN